jgi:hypothetical protein
MSMTTARSIQDRRERRGAWIAGVASIEFAILAPLLIAVVLGVVDFGSLVSDASALVGAVRAGAEDARYDAANTSAIDSDITGFTTFSTANAQNLSVSPPVLACYCISNGGTVVAAPGGCPSAGGANPCISVQSNANGNIPSTDQRLLRYVNVTATISPYTPAIGVANSLLPGVISGTIWARVQ